MSSPSTQQTLRVALLSDVHGNLPALEAVITDARAQGASVFWHLGDSLGYGPFVNEVVDRLFEICAVQVIGNYDLKTLKFPKNKVKWRKRKNPDKYRAFEWAWETLTPENADRLAALPRTETQTLGGLTVLLTHGGPASVDEAIGRDTPRARLEALAEMTDANAILCGHAHLPFYEKTANRWFVNPGSVGRPEGGDPCACYMILDCVDQDLAVRFRRVAYDVERLCGAIRTAGLPEEFGAMFRTGRNLDQVQQGAVKSDRGVHAGSDQALTDVYRFAEACQYEAGHSQQVMTLATALFQALAPVHRLDAHALFLLRCAALLHDIGWLHGQAGHHKQSMRMILDDDSMTLCDIDRKLIALVARYHRKALPKPHHRVYADLSVEQQALVHRLGGMLRMADGLDRSHRSVVTDLEVRISEGRVDISCQAEGSAELEMGAAHKKSDLFEMGTGFKSSFVRRLSASDEPVDLMAEAGD